MVSSRKNSKTSNKTKFALAMTMGVLVFFNNFTMATPFETPEDAETIKKISVSGPEAQQTLHFDCQNPDENLAVSTVQENIRLEAKNCESKVNFKNDILKNPLLTFPAGVKKFASELAYLRKGENMFSILHNEKIYKVNVRRLE